LEARRLEAPRGGENFAAAARREGCAMHEMKKKQAMNCAEFHEQLPLLMESGRSLEDEPHLQSCENCSALVRDLQYIAEQAKLLLPLHDPNPRVWNSIQDSLTREGLVKEGRTPGPGRIVDFPRRNNRVIAAWAAGIAAVLAVTIGLMRTAPAPAVETAIVAIDGLSGEDAQVVAEIERRSPGIKTLYVANLRSVNAYIDDAKRALEQEPDNDEAAEHLREAYAQKAMLYERATTRSLD
jgi:hypothetical protein